MRLFGNLVITPGDVIALGLIGIVILVIVCAWIWVILCEIWKFIKSIFKIFKMPDKDEVSENEGGSNDDV